MKCQELPLVLSWEGVTLQQALHVHQHLPPLVCKKCSFPLLPVKQLQGFIVNTIINDIIPVVLEPLECGLHRTAGLSKVKMVWTGYPPASLRALSIRTTAHLLSKPKLNQHLNSTEFEVGLNSYTVIHHHHPPHKLSLYTQNWTELTTAQLASKNI